MHWGRRLKALRRFLLAGLVLATMAGCTQDQIGGLFESSFSTTPRCGMTDKLLSFSNDSSQDLEIAGIGIAAGSNPDGYFTIEGLIIGNREFIAPLSSGGIGEVTVPAGDTYTIQIRYSPTKNTGETPHAAFIDIAYLSPEPGIVQISVQGTSEGEVDCPEVVIGEEVGLDGPVDLTITRLVAASPQIAEPLDSSLGITPFIPVELLATLDATAGTIDFPAITANDSFILPPPDPKVSPTLDTLVKGDTIITTRNAVVGTYDDAVGLIELQGLKVDLIVEGELFSEINLTLDATTGTVAFRQYFPAIVPKNAGFPVIDDEVIAGTPIQSDGTVILVGLANVDQAVGELSSAQGKMAVMIEAVILCENGTTECAP